MTGFTRTTARAIVRKRPPSFAIVGLAALAAGGCHTDMWRQPKQEPLGISGFYVDGAASRPLQPGTVPRDHLRQDEPYFTGAENGTWIDRLPMPLTKALLDRGEERFNIFCSPCHGRLGNGQGMIAQRGFALRRPVGNYHTDRLRKMPAGYYYDVITQGYGTMYGYASRIEPQDRWAIVAYVKALQLSQNVPAGSLTAAQRADLAKDMSIKDHGGPGNPGNPTPEPAEHHEGGAAHEGAKAAGGSGLADPDTTKRAGGKE